MNLAQEVYDAAKQVSVANRATLAEALNLFIGKFVGWPFRAASGFVRDSDGITTAAFASVVYKSSESTDRAGAEGFPADAVAVVIDACENLDLESLRAAYDRIAHAKRLKKSKVPSVPGVSITTVTLGIIFALRSSMSLEAIGEVVDQLNERTPGRERTDMIVVSSTGTVHYAVQFPGEGVEYDFLPPAEGAFDKYTLPIYIVMVMRPTGAFTLNKMIAFLIGHLAIFSPGARLPPWIEILKGVSKFAVILLGYQYNLRGELLPVPKKFYNDLYLAPPLMRLEDKQGNLLSTIQFLPWQDGGVILLRGKLPMEELWIYLDKEVLKRGGLIKLRDAQISYVLPITQDDFVQMLARFMRQSNMVVRPQEANWVVMKFANEGSRTPFIARLLSGVMRLRDAAIPEMKTREEFDNAYDAVIKPLFSARESVKQIAGLWEKHAQKVASGEIAHLRGGNICIDESVDKELGRETDAFLSAATRALKQGMQGVALLLGANIGFVFQKQAGFEAGLTELVTSDPALAEYLRHTRLWSERLVGCRNAIEHEGWRLPDVSYMQTEDGVSAAEPQVDGQPVSQYVAKMFDRLICFVEEVTVHYLQKRLPPGIAFTELTPALRAADMPERFRMTLTDGGMPPWTILFHSSTFEET